MIVDNLDRLAQALEIQLNDLGDDAHFEHERASLHRLFAEIARIREASGKSLRELPGVPEALGCIAHAASAGSSRVKTQLDSERHGSNTSF